MLTTTGCDLDPLFYIKNKRGTCKSSNKNRISYIKNHAKEGDILFTGVSASAKFDEFFAGRLEKIAKALQSFVCCSTQTIWN